MDTPSPPSSLDLVGSLLDEFLAGGEVGEEAFERFVARHPEHADALRGLRAAWAGVLAALPSERDEGEPWGGVVPEAGTMLGGFRLIRLLGEGGMGRVWEAEQIALGRRVALKLVRPGLEPGGLDRLWREARAAGRINHRGIVPVFEVGEIEGQPFIVEQLVGDGTTLADLIARGRAGRRPDPREVAARFVEIAEALQAAHEGGIVHGDIKPQNILIDRDGRPRVSDFGLSHVGGEREAADRLRGTAAYMSPEQASGSGRVDARSDVFSLGAVLYEALTLERALPGTTTAEVLERLRAGAAPAPPRALNPRVSRDLSAVCLRALARDPADRYGNLSGFADDLGRFLRHEPVSARPVGALARSGKWARRNPGKAVAIVMTAVLVATLGAMLAREARLRRQAETDALDARRSSYVATLRTAQVRLEQGQPVEARRRLDECAADLRGWEWELLSRDAGSLVLVLDGHPAGSVQVAVSPTGDRIVTAADDGRLRVFDGQSGAPIASLIVNDALGRALPLGPVALAGDGHAAACGTSDGRVVLVDPQRRVVADALAGDRGDVTSVAISKDGGRIVSSMGGTLRFWEGQEQARGVVPYLRGDITTVATSADGSVVAMASGYGHVSVWSGLDDELPYDLNGYERGPSVVAIDEAGRRVAAGLDSGWARVWDTDTSDLARWVQLLRTTGMSRGGGRGWIVPGDEVPRSVLLFETQVSSSAVACIALSGDGRRLAIAPAAEGPVQVWDVDTQREIARHAGLRGRVTSLAATRTGDRIVAGCEDGAAYVWDQRDQEPHSPQHWGSPDFVGRALAASADGATVAACAPADRRLRVWRDGVDLPLAPAATLVHSLAIDGAGDTLAAGLIDGSLALWSLPAPAVARTLPVATQSIEGLALSFDGRTAVAAAGRDLLRVDLGTGAVVRWSGHADAITRVVAAADLAAVATASTDGTVRLWDGRSGASRLLLDDGPYVDHVLALDATGRWLAALPSDGGRLHVFALQPEPIEIARLVMPRGGVPCLAFVSDRARLVSSSTTSPRLTIWDTESGEELVDVAGESAGLFGLESGGSSRLFGLAGDGSLRVWE